MFTKKVSLVKGLNFVEYDLSADEKYLKKEEISKAKNNKYDINKGIYLIEMEVNKAKFESKLIIEDPKQ